MKLVTLNNGIRLAVIEKVTFEQSFERTQDVSREDIWGRTIQAEGAASVKTLRQGECLVCLRKSKEVRVAGQSQPAGKPC